MMKEPCESFVAAIMADGTDLPPEIIAHLETCRNCRKLADDWNAIRGAVDRVDVPATLDRNIKDAAHEHYRRFRMVRRTVIKTVYMAAAAACVMLISGVFFFNDHRPLDRRLSPASPTSTWYSGLDRRIFELDTEIELNREMLNLSPDNRKQEILDLLLPPPPPGYTVDFDDEAMS